LLDVRCRTVDQMRLATIICNFVEVAGRSLSHSVTTSGPAAPREQECKQ
jgi:hypothetical protein